MDKAKKARLARRGWEFGSAECFLSLTPEEGTYVEIKLSLAQELRQAHSAWTSSSGHSSPPAAARAKSPRPERGHSSLRRDRSAWRTSSSQSCLTP